MVSGASTTAAQYTIIFITLNIRVCVEYVVQTCIITASCYVPASGSLECLGFGMAGSGFHSMLRNLWQR